VSNSLRAKLIFHGSIVILLGLLAGIPYALVVLGSMQGEIRAWRMAHLEGVLNGLVCLGAAGVFAHLTLDAKKQSILTWALIAMAYANVFASIIGASTGNRGLEFAAPAANIVVFLLFTIAIVGVFVGVGLLAYGARPSGGGGATSDIQVEVSTSTSPSSASRPQVSSSSSTDVDVEVSVSGDEGGDGDDEPVSRATRRRNRRKR